MAKQPRNRTLARDEAIRKLYINAPANKRNTEVINELAHSAGVTVRLVQLLIAKYGWERITPYDRKYNLGAEPKPKQKIKKIKVVALPPEDRAKLQRQKDEIKRLKNREVVPEPVYISSFNITGNGQPEKEYDTHYWNSVGTDEQINLVTQVLDTFLETAEHPISICQNLGIPKRYFRKWIRDNFVCKDIWYRTIKDYKEGLQVDMVFFLADLVKNSMEFTNEGKATVTSEFISTGVDAEGNIKGFWKPTKKVQQPPEPPNIALLQELNKTIISIHDKVEIIRNEIIDVDNTDGLTDLSEIEIQIAQAELEIEKLKKGTNE